MISQWVRKPLGDRSSLVVNSNSINIKNKTVVSSRVKKVKVSKIVQKENIDISTLCNVVNVSPRKVDLNTSSHDINLPVVDKSVHKSYSSEILNQVTDVDSQDDGLPLLVSEYVQEIYQHLWHLETQPRVPKMFLHGHRVSP